MTQADNRILEILEESGLTLSPKVLAYNADYTRNYMTNRLAELREAGLVERVDEGLYQITDRGRQYLAGEISADELERDE